jgi:hypothetical protein
MTKPFKTVTIEYFEELDTEERQLIRDAADLAHRFLVNRRIKVVTTTKQWLGLDKDPIVCTTFEYL